MTNSLIHTAIRRIICFVMTSVVAIASVQAQGLEIEKKKRANLEKDIALLNKQIATASSQSETALSAISMIQAKEKLQKKQITQTQVTIDKLNAQIRQVTGELGHQQEVLDTLQAHYERLVAGAYKNRDIKKWYMYILSSDNVAQAFRRFGYFKNLSSQIKTSAKKIEELQISLNEKKSTLIGLKYDAQKLKKQKEKELTELKANEERQKALVAKLKKDSKAFQKALANKKKEKIAIDKRIEQMLRAEAERAKKKKGKPVDTVLAARFEQNKGKLPWPVIGPVAEHFGPYKNKQLNINMVNNGINIVCEDGSKIHAVFDGVVSNVMLAPGYGQCILIQHGDYYSSYCKVKTSYVKQGDKIKTGQTIGEVATIMGKTQLYFLIFKQHYLDPEEWLRDQ